MHAARMSLSLALLTACADESDGAWYSARQHGTAVEVLRVDVEKDSCIYFMVGEGADPEYYGDVDRKPSSQALGLVSWSSGAEYCTFDTNSFQPVDEVSGKIRVEDLRMTALPTYSIGCRLSFDLTLVSGTQGEVHTKAVDLPVASPLCDSPYRAPVELHELSAEVTSASSFAVFAWEPSFEVCVRASFGWFSSDYVDINPAETPTGWVVDIEAFRVEQDACGEAGVMGAIYAPADRGMWGSANFEGGDAGQPPCSIDLDLTTNMILNYHWVPPRVHFRANGVAVDGC